ncbi:VWA domain-containing protein [bacterium]|nr:VWA domain-containing protein [candidate division CSSED10-310 bacterium]
MSFRLMHPEMLLLLLLIPVLLGGWIFLKLPLARIRYPRIDVWKTIPGAVSKRPVWIPRILRLTALIFLIFSAARPQSGESREVVFSEGVDIAIALDISGSMRALDFQPQNRLEVAKQVIRGFIEKREHDRIGLVLFGSESFTLCPLTLDHDLLLEFLDQARIGMVQEQTAIGKAIANAVNRLRVSETTRPAGAGPSSDTREKSQLVIMCTDGVNNVQSKIDPITAAKAAAALGIKIHTIGVGTKGLVDMPDPRFPGRTVRVQVDLDEDTLREIADITGGQYFHAMNPKALIKIFEIIDRMEKMDIDSFKYTRYTEQFVWPLLAAGFLLILEIVLRQTVYRRFP